MIYHLEGFEESPLARVPDGVTHLFGLVLNPMRGRTEEQRFLAASESREELKAFWQGEKVAPYNDGNWAKVYRQGGRLEWFNPPFGSDTDDYGNGIIELRRDGWRRIA